MSLYAQYIDELKCGREIIEDDKSFIVYYRHPDQVYIEDTYVSPEFRNGETFRGLFNKILEVAKKHSIDIITHAIVKTHADFDKMEKRSIRYGFKKVGETDTECLYLRRLRDE